jgi:hypothetical protein
LVDDGNGSPDVDQFDGIYSGTFIPTVDGSYKITVQIQNDMLGQVLDDTRIDSRLLPVDQTQFGCYQDEDEDCGALRLKNFYESSVDLYDTIKFINRNEFISVSLTRLGYFGLNLTNLVIFTGQTNQNSKPTNSS